MEVEGGGGRLPCHLKEPADSDQRIWLRQELRLQMVNEDVTESRITRD